MARSPISAPSNIDKTPVATTAIARGADETLWALIQVLIEKKVIEPEALSRKLDPVRQELNKTGPMTTQEDIDRSATYLAVDRMARAIQALVGADDVLRNDDGTEMTIEQWREKAGASGEELISLEELRAAVKRRETDNKE
jgi:hypothetical protein